MQLREETALYASICEKLEMLNCPISSDPRLKSVSVDKMEQVAFKVAQTFIESVQETQAKIKQSQSRHAMLISPQEVSSCLPKINHFLNDIDL